MKLIALDDGHGMETAGKRTFEFPDGSIMKENEFNREVVDYLDKILRNNGFNTVKVAPTDADTPLSKRVNKANSEKADIYISVHADAYGSMWNEANGFTMFIYKFGGEAQKIAKKINTEFQKGTLQRNRGIKEANFYVLRKTNMPAVLIECAFMTNMKEAKLLRSDEFRYECAKEICEGICSYYGINFKEEVNDESNTPIINSKTATLNQVEEWAKNKGATDTFISLANLYWNLASKRGGVDPVVAYAQFAKETGYGKFGGVIDESFKNPCGLKIFEGGENDDPNAHKVFNSWKEGIIAHLDHLALYAGAEGYPREDTPDPRHFKFIKGKAITVEQLGGNWAPSKEYGKDIVKIIMEIRNIKETGENIENITETIVLEKNSGMKFNGIIINGKSYLQVNELRKLGKEVNWNSKDKIVEIEL